MLLRSCTICRQSILIHEHTALRLTFRPWATADNEPIRFAVGPPDGLTSNSWRFWTTSSGDAYLACRDNFQNMKVSLHASGRWRMAFTSEALAKNPALVPAGANRAWEVWDEPPPVLPDTVVAFRLIFPTIELAVKPEQRTTKQWRNTVFIESAPPDVAS
jgi:hypothetical protein